MDSMHTSLLHQYATLVPHFISPHKDPALWHQKSSFPEQSHCHPQDFQIAASLKQAIKGCLSQRPHDYDNILIWVACCVGFFGFFGVEISHTQWCRLQPQHTFVLGQCSTYRPRGGGGSLAFHLNIKASKADQFHRGVRYFWLAPGHYIYPMQPSLDNYLPFNVLAAINYLHSCLIRKQAKVGAVTSAIQGVSQDTSAFNRFMHRHKKQTTDWMDVSMTAHLW